MTSSLNQRMIVWLPLTIIQQILLRTLTVNGQVCDLPGQCKDMTFTAVGNDLHLRCEAEGSCQNAVIESAGNNLVTGNVNLKCWVGEDEGQSIGQVQGHACQGMNIFKNGGGANHFTLECGKVDYVENGGRPRQACSKMNVYCRSPICIIREMHDVAFKTTTIYGESANSLRIELHDGHSRDRSINVYCPTKEGTECKIDIKTSFGECSDCSSLQPGSKGPPLDEDIVFHVTCPGRIVVDCADGNHAANKLRYSVDGVLTDIVDPCHNQVDVAEICPVSQPLPTTSPTTSSPTVSPSSSPTTTSPTSSPSSSPTTSSPSSSPTESPTSSSPTSSPSSTPTTNSPSSSITVSPTTSSPTSEGTASPTTNSPTKSPTSSPTGSPTTSSLISSTDSSLPKTASISSQATSQTAVSPTTISPTTKFTASPYIFERNWWWLVAAGCASCLGLLFLLGFGVSIIHLQLSQC